ncbi:hypothetical protein [Rhizobium leguminosarum]|uniref:hypothetical protein n=1 Tax=Rhizobium leguminosarum TaxID=384 RepID=UPI003F9E9C36
MILRQAFVLTVFLAFLSINAGVARAIDPADVLTPANIAKFSPRARADLVASLIDNRSMFKAVGIVTPRTFYHFMAQIATETGGLVRLDENMNYSAERLLVIFPRRVNAEQAQRLAHRPVAIANHVYGNRLGNRGRQTNDGWNYRGSGFIQLTGRDNFIARGKEVALGLGETPELARAPKEGLLAATAYWNARQINSPAEANSIESVRRAVNGGLIGIKEAKLWLARAHRAFGPALKEANLESADVVADANAEELEAATGILQDLGYLDTDGLEGADSSADIDSAVRELQRSRGLPETGADVSTLEAAEGLALPEDVLYELTDTQRLVEQRENESR